LSSGPPKSQSMKRARPPLRFRRATRLLSRVRFGVCLGSRRVEGEQAPIGHTSSNIGCLAVAPRPRIGEDLPPRRRAHATEGLGGAFPEVLDDRMLSIELGLIARLLDERRLGRQQVKRHLSGELAN